MRSDGLYLIVVGGGRYTDFEEAKQDNQINRRFLVYIGTRLSTYSLITSPASFHITVCIKKYSKARLGSSFPGLETNPLPFLFPEVS